MKPTLIGYLPKQTAVSPDWLGVPSVKEICNASRCISRAPEGWLLHPQLNAASLFDTEAIASTAIAASRQAFEIYAFSLFPVVFAATADRPLPMPKLSVAPLPSDFRSLGYDAVSNSGASGPCDRGPDTIFFECSPLSCNSMAKEIEVNEHCLLNSCEEAFRVAREFVHGDVEPGPYLVVEVFRKLVI